MVVWSLCDWTPHIYPASTPITNLMWPGPSSPLVVLYCTAFWSWGALSHTAPIPPSFKSSRVLAPYPSEATVLPASLFGEDHCLLLEIFLLLLSHCSHHPLRSLFSLHPLNAY